MHAERELDPAGGQEDHLHGFFGRDIAYVALFSAQLVLAAVSTPVLTRLLGSQQFGVVAVWFTVMQLLVGVATWGLPTVAQRAYADSGDMSARRVLSLGILIGVLVCTIAAATGRWWAPGLKLGPFHGVAAYTVTWALLSSITATALAVLRSRDRLKHYTLVMVTQTSLAELVSIILVVTIHRTASEYILGELIAQAIAVIVALGLVRPAPLRISDRARLRAWLRFGGGLVPTAFTTFVLQSSDRLIVNAELGHRAAARYAVASNVGSFVLIALASLSSSWMPRTFAIEDRGELGTTVSRTRDGLVLLTVPVMLGVCAISPFVLQLWAPPSYGPRTLQLPVAVIVLSVLPSISSFAYTQILMHAKHARAVAIASFSAAAANVILNLVLVPAVGIVGASAATFVASGLGLALLTRAGRDIVRLDSLSKKLLAQVGAAAALSLAIVVLPLSLPFMVFRGVIALACGALALCVLLSLSGRGERRIPPAIRGWVQANTARPVRNP